MFRNILTYITVILTYITDISTVFSLQPAMPSEKDTYFYRCRTEAMEMMDHFLSDNGPTLSESVSYDKMR